MRSVIFRVLLVLGALVGVVLAIGLGLPRDHTATSRITIERPPDSVWAVVRDLGALVDTWSEIRSARRLPSVDGKEVWEQDFNGVPMRLVVVSADPPRRLVTKVDAGKDAAFGGTWTYTLAPEGRANTTVTVTEDGYVRNPFFRVLMGLMGVHRTTDSYLRALSDKFGEAARPEHVRTN